MTKDEFIKALQESDVPGDTLVVLSSDEEGNSYRSANLDTTLSKAYPEGYDWQVLHPDDVQEYEDYGVVLTNCIVVW